MPFFQATDPFDSSNRLCTSWLLSPAVLFFQRAVFSLYAFVSIFFILGYVGTHSGEAGQDFSYFTALTYWGLAFYNAFAALHTFTYWRSGAPLLARWPRVLQEMHRVFYSTIVVYPFLVTIVYWSIIYGGFSGAYSTWTNTTRHALNSVYALVEIFIPRTEPLSWWHLIPLIILLALYLALAFVTYATQGFYVYSFLDHRLHSQGVVAGYIFGILVAIIIVFLVVRYLIWLRVWVTERKLGLTGKFTTRDAGIVHHENKDDDIQMRTLVDNSKAV